MHRQVALRVCSNGGGCGGVARTGRTILRCHPWRHGNARTSTTTTSSSNNNSGSSHNPNNHIPTSSSKTATVALASLAIGFLAGHTYGISTANSDANPGRVLPSGLPRTCCDESPVNGTPSPPPLTEAQLELLRKLRRIVGKENVLDGTVLDSGTAPFLKGARLGAGPAMAIVTPRALHEVVRVVKAAVEADCVIVPQGQNTGLTGGSVPRQRSSHDTQHPDTDTDTRPVILLSMKYLNRILPIDDGRRMVCLAGVGLAQLQNFLDKHFPDRESHSVLGSTFLNPTTAAGVAFGSGGTQCRKGPAYTERALYIQVHTNKWRENIVHVINTLDIEGIEEPNLPPGRAREVMDSVPYKLDSWTRFVYEGNERDILYTKSSCKAKASDTDYAEQLCQCDDASLSRFNADTRGPDFVRSEGKVIILATVHDTFPKPRQKVDFWLSFDSLETALAFRKEVCLDNPHDVPLSVEYMDRDAFDVIDQAGRFLGNLIKLTGTSSSIVRHLWNVKLWIEGLPYPGANEILDKIVFKINPFLPTVLAPAIMVMGRTKDHHIALSVGDFGQDELNRVLDRLQAFATKHGPEKIAIYECGNSWEAAGISAFRFAAAPAFRTWCVGQGVQGFSVDYVLPKNGGIPPSAAAAASPAMQMPLKRMRYSHFACNVVHEDIAYDNSVDIHQAKYTLKRNVEEECGGKLPAEHGHGTEYVAPPDTQARWKKMDPLNMFNPGVGGTSTKYRYQD